MNPVVAPVVVSQITDDDVRRTRRGGATGIRAGWLRDIANLAPGQKGTITIEADNEDDFNRICASRSTAIYRRTKDGSRAIGYDPVVRRNWANRTMSVHRPVTQENSDNSSVNQTV